MHTDERDKGQKRVLEDTEMAVEALGASCIVKPTAQDTTGARGQSSQDGTKGQCGSCSTVCGPRTCRAAALFLVELSEGSDSLSISVNKDTVLHEWLFSPCYYLKT